MDQSTQVDPASPAEALGGDAMPGWTNKVAVFLVGQTISTFGSYLVQYAIIWHLTLTTKSGVILALAAVFVTLARP